MGLRERLAKARRSLTENMNVLFKRGPQVDEGFWEDLEETLILSDLGAQAADEIVERLRDTATRNALPDAYAVLDLLADTIEDLFAVPECDPFGIKPVCVLFVGINGAGKTTTVGKLANQGLASGRKPLIGSADTFRAAAIEQLDEWGRRSGVEVVKRERGADPASVCYDVIDRAEAAGSDLVLIDTSGRLHTSADLMRELEKVVTVTRKRAAMEVKVVLVIDATTGQNGLQQAREFNKALGLDGVIMTKLDGTAKGGIAVAVSHELGLPILRMGVGEGIEDLQPFDAHAYAEALFGEMRDDEPADEAADEMCDDEPAAADEAADEVCDDEPAAADEPVEAEADLEAAAEEAVLEVEAGAEPKPAAEPDVEARPEAMVQSESEVEVAVEPEPEAEATPDAELEAEPEPEDAPQPEPEPEQPKKKWWQKLF